MESRPNPHTCRHQAGISSTLLHIENGPDTNTQTCMRCGATKRACDVQWTMPVKPTGFADANREAFGKLSRPVWLAYIEGALSRGATIVQVGGAVVRGCFPLTGLLGDQPLQELDRIKDAVELQNIPYLKEHLEEFIKILVSEATSKDVDITRRLQKIFENINPAPTRPRYNLAGKSCAIYVYRATVKVPSDLVGSGHRDLELRFSANLETVEAKQAAEQAAIELYDCASAECKEITQLGEGLHFAVSGYEEKA